MNDFVKDTTEIPSLSFGTPEPEPELPVQQPEEKKEYTEDEKTKIDEYDQMMAEIRAKKKAEKELGLV